MGYTTYFNGNFEIKERNSGNPINEELKIYINRFSLTRRMTRDNNKIKEVYPNWEELCFHGNLGTNGEYFIGERGFTDESVINYNGSSPQPGLWCQWIINNKGELVWDSGEKFYNYVEWLEYLIKNFFEPEGYILNGEVTFEGEDDDDFGVIVCKDNHVNINYGYRIMNLSELDTNELIEELNNRGYTVSE